MVNEPRTQSQEELKGIQEASQRQALPDQRAVFSISEKIRRRVHNLPDPARPPLGYDEHKAFDRVFPYVRLPRLHPPNHGDTVIFNAPELPANQLILGDNLEVLRTLPPECIDLIYIDPPFFSGRTYNVIWGDTNEVRTFYDIWEGGIDSYLIWLNARLWEMWRVVKKTGSIYVHSDWHASHYIKSEMDKIFGYENLRNEIIWFYPFAGRSKSTFPRKHDTLFWYSKGRDYTFNNSCSDVRVPVTDQCVVHNFRYVDENGRRYRDDPRKSGKIYRYYLDEGKLPEDVWTDIQSLHFELPERIGYPTQKPEKLLQRIIAAHTKEGDVVADLFCGGGTTCAVAMKLNRRFIGCDSSRVAIAVTLDRLVKMGEDMSGVKSNISTGGAPVQEQFQVEGAVAELPNIEVSYLGVYPLDKFELLSQDDFVDFVLTCYGASRNTAEGVAHGFPRLGRASRFWLGLPMRRNPLTPTRSRRSLTRSSRALSRTNRCARRFSAGVSVDRCRNMSTFSNNMWRTTGWFLNRMGRP